jgi:hypothetical protein
MRSPRRFTKKFVTLRWRECSIWEMFLSWSITDSITTHFRNNNLSTSGRSWFFIRRLLGVKSRTPKVSRRSLVNACERESVSAKSFPKSRCAKRGTGVRTPPRCEKPDILPPPSFPVSSIFPHNLTIPTYDLVATLDLIATLVTFNVDLPTRIRSPELRAWPVWGTGL